MLTEYFVSADLHTTGVYNATPAHPTDWLIEAFGGSRSSAGVRVNADSALSYAPWWQGISIISGDVARLPLDAFKRTTDDDREKQRQLSAWRSLNQIANPLMSGYTLRETMMSHALSWGNAFAAIVRIGVNVDQLIPIHPSAVRIETPEPGVLAYVMRDDKGREYIYGEDEILHLRGLGDDGIRGYSVFSLARNSIGFGLAAEEHGSRHFANGAKPGLILSHPANLQKPQADQLLAQWEARHGGVHNTSRPALLTGGLTATALGMSNEDSQWLESRKFQRDDVASWLCMPPHKLGSDSRVSYNSLEAEERAYVSQTLARWLKRWESECFRKLFSRSQQLQNWYWEHNTGALIQGDMATQATVLRTLVDGMIISRNEARKKLNMNTRPGLDEFVNPNTTGGSEEADDTTDPIPDDDTAEAMRDLIRDRMEHLVKTETRTLREMLDRPDQLTQRIHGFYAKFVNRVRDAIHFCVRAYAIACPANVHHTSASVAQRYCDESCAVVCETIDADGLPKFIQQFNDFATNWIADRPCDVIQILETEPKQ